MTKNSKKTQQTSVKMAKITASNYGLKNHYEVYKTQHLALTTIIS